MDGCDVMRMLTWIKSVEEPMSGPSRSGPAGCDVGYGLRELLMTWYAGEVKERYRANVGMLSAADAIKIRVWM